MTSLFADIVGSTSLGERLPPDEVKALIGECVNRMSRAVEAFGGMVQAYMGDGICAYFGVPVAHPDDPERAARAARRILRLVGDYGRDIADAWGLPDFKVRIGINSGLAAVGKVGANDPQHVALGDATNVAARLQAHAAPGTVVVGEETARQLSHRFGLEPLGRVGVKGRSEDVSAFMLLGPRRKPPHSPAAPLIGRARERARLEAVMAGLAAGRGQVLLVVGEPGLGKSRLLEELRAVAPQGTVWLAGHCASYGGELPYWPFVEMLRAWLEVEEGDAEIAVRTKLRAKLGRLMGEAAGRVLPQLAWLLGITMDPQVHAGLGERSSGDVGQEIVEAYAGWIESLTSSSPVVVALDDLHWADASTRELADRLLEVTDGAPLAVASALEPESGSEGWGWRLRVLGDYSHRVTEVILEPLPHDAAEQLVDAVTPAGRLDPDVKSQILDRAEGNPFYIEQLIRTLLDAGGVQRRREPGALRRGPACPPPWRPFWWRAWIVWLRRPGASRRPPPSSVAGSR